jgi:hypothetical protein
MTPKEEAKKICDEYFEIVKSIDWRKTNSPPMFIAHVKKCALTSVDKILEATEDYYACNDYWQEVKQEIQQL